MALLTKAPRGTADILPGASGALRTVENDIFDVASRYGCKEIRTPVFEHTELFSRSVGETTDVVQKEMYTFNDNGGRSVTLKPEGTAGAVRAFIEHGLFNEPMPVKMCYFTPCYRYEKPQAGRLREFHQFGVECFGSASAVQDAEMISLASDIFDSLGVEGLRLEINSIGCPECRKNYQTALKAYFTEHIDELCDTCRSRLGRNPMRILDCKNPECAALAASSPLIIDYLCSGCEEHFAAVKTYLDAMEIDYTVNPRIVRGLDYYTRTVFEFISSDLGAQSTVCGGGRYDGLVAELGGKDTPACGFAMGMERLMLILAAQGISVDNDESPDLYIASMNDAACVKAAQLASSLRSVGLRCVFDTVGRSLKAQMKYADKTGASYTMVLGDDEIANGSAKVKNMSDGSETPLELDGFESAFLTLLLASPLSE